MKVLIVSDTHRRNENLEKVLKKVKPIDMLIHCGDAEGTEAYIQQICDCPMYIVAGNNDFFSNLQHDLEFRIREHKVFMTHGHHYYVSVGLNELINEAKVRGADIAIYGHTHLPLLELRDGVMIINPGSMSYPRQSGRIPTYVIMEIDDAGNTKYTLNYLTDR